MFYQGVRLVRGPAGAAARIFAILAVVAMTLVVMRRLGGRAMPIASETKPAEQERPNAIDAAKTSPNALPCQRRGVACDLACFWFCV